MLTKQRVKELALQVGFDLCGVAAVRPFPKDRARFDRWLDAGCQASLGYLERNIEKRFDAARLVEGARTVVVCAVSYKHALSDGYPAGTRGKIASYACNPDYHTVLKAMLHELFQLLKVEDPHIAGRAFVDSAPIAEKRWAVEAGLGWIGRQSLLITPEFGSFVHLGELVINTPCDRYDLPFGESPCGTCRACLEACPNGAIHPTDRMIDTRLCIACHTIEQKPSCKVGLDGWIFGCDLCQSCCPYNRRAPMARNGQLLPLFDPRELSTDDWLTMDEVAFEARFGSTPLTRSGLRRLQENLQE